MKTENKPFIIFATIAIFVAVILITHIDGALTKPHYPKIEQAIYYKSEVTSAPNPREITNGYSSIEVLDTYARLMREYQDRRLEWSKIFCAEYTPVTFDDFIMCKNLENI